METGADRHGHFLMPVPQRQLCSADIWETVPPSILLSPDSPLLMLTRMKKIMLLSKKHLIQKKKQSLINDLAMSFVRIWFLNFIEIFLPPICNLLHIDKNY
jgi:hypothetical protein